MITEVYDLETLKNLFTYTGYCLQDKKYYQFVIHKSLNQSEELYKHLKRDKEMYQVGFNNKLFDYPLLHFFLVNYPTRFKYMDGEQLAKVLYDKAQEIITSDGYTAIKEKNELIVQYDLRLIWHYDNKAKLTSLKDLEFVMQMENIQEMPFSHNTYIHDWSQIVEVLNYNKNDVFATTKFLFVTLGITDYSEYKGKNKIELRTNLTKKFRVSTRNLGDVKIGEQLVLKLYADAVGQSTYDIKNLKTERPFVELKDCIPSWCKIKTPQFNKFLEVLKKTSINIENGDKFKHSVIFHGISFDFGLGGTHGCIKPGVYNADSEYVIYDMDVSSLYPSIAKSLDLYPAHLGPEFTKLYSKFIEARIAEKHKPKAERDMVLIEGYKLILNGVYGKSGESTSFLYDPLYTFKTTIAGQLFISMWAERMVEVVPDLTFLQINTDGITIKVKKSDIDKIVKVCNELTDETTLQIEDAYYSRMIIQDVNNYIAVYEDSKSDAEHIKLKGLFTVDVEYHKDSSMKVVPLALKNYFVYGKPIEDTIRNHKNIYDFCLRLKVNHSTKAYWHSIVNGNELNKTLLSRTTRYFVSNKGGGLVVYYNNSANPTRINTGFNTTLFNTYYKADDYNINYNFYETECRKIIDSVDDKQLTLF